MTTGLFNGDTAAPDPEPGGLITVEYLQTTLADQTEYDTGLAAWAIEVVSNTARLVANRMDWTAGTIPAVVKSTVSLAARRLYTNPDRFTRENSGDYGYSLDPSVTNADVFTPTELATLRKYAPQSNQGGLRTISTTRGDAYAPDGTEYVPDGNPYYHGFPWYVSGTPDSYHTPGA